MTGLTKRLDSLYSGLTAKERGILALKAWKEDRELEPKIRSGPRPQISCPPRRIIPIATL